MLVHVCSVLDWTGPEVLEVFLHAEDAQQYADKGSPYVFVNEEQVPDGVTDFLQYMSDIYWARWDSAVSK
jgi:hypothetical protein